MTSKHSVGLLLLILLLRALGKVFVALDDLRNDDQTTFSAAKSSLRTMLHSSTLKQIRNRVILLIHKIPTS